MPERTREWLTLGEATRLLDVSPATLRRWGDAGRVTVFTTPGGHRRFSRAALERLLTRGAVAPGPRPALTTLTPARLRRTYRAEARRAATEVPWVGAMSEAEIAWFRERGRRMAALLIAHLDGDSPEAAAHALSEAGAIAAEYGRMTAEVGLSMSQAVEGFLRFRRPFLHELASAAQRRGLDIAETTTLLESAERAMDRLLVALLGAHGVTRVGEVMGHAHVALARPVAEAGGSAS